MYTAGIVQNRPFVDGNRRTGFIEEAAAQSILELAASTIDEKGFCAFLRANVERAPEDEPENEP
jgi:death-on-curing protein